MQNKLNIAIIIPGHLRFWSDCKSNFLDNVYDTDHNIDVYFDTYETVFHSEGKIYDEWKKSQFLNEKEILNLFDGINIVHYKVEKSDKNMSQEKKLQSAYKLLVEKGKKYDLVVKTRFDIMFEKKIDYRFMYEECVKKPKLIFIGKGGSDGLLNDMFAVCLPETFEIYVDRFKYGDLPVFEGLQHGSLKQIIDHHGIEYNTDTWVLLKRVNGIIQKMGI